MFSSAARASDDPVGMCLASFSSPPPLFPGVTNYDAVAPAPESSAPLGGIFSLLSNISSASSMPSNPASASPTRNTVSNRTDAGTPLPTTVKLTKPAADSLRRTSTPKAEAFENSGVSLPVAMLIGRGMKRQVNKLMELKSAAFAADVAANKVATTGDATDLKATRAISGARAVARMAETEFHSVSSLKARSQLRHHRGVIATIEQWWTALPRSRQLQSPGEAQQGGSDEVLLKRTYCWLLALIFRSLFPDGSKAEERATVAKDWAADSRGAPWITHKRFHECIFNFADIWCESVDPAEYVAFLGGYADRIAASHTVGLQFRLATELRARSHQSPAENKLQSKSVAPRRSPLAGPPPLPVRRHRKLVESHPIRPVSGRSKPSVVPRCFPRRRNHFVEVRLDDILELVEFLQHPSEEPPVGGTSATSVPAALSEEEEGSAAPLTTMWDSEQQSFCKRFFQIPMNNGALLERDVAVCVEDIAAALGSLLPQPIKLVHWAPPSSRIMSRRLPPTLFDPLYDKEWQRQEAEKPSDLLPAAILWGGGGSRSHSDRTDARGCEDVVQRTFSTRIPSDFGPNSVEKVIVLSSYHKGSRPEGAKKPSSVISRTPAAPSEYLALVGSSSAGHPSVQHRTVPKRPLSATERAAVPVGTVLPRGPLTNLSLRPPQLIPRSTGPTSLNGNFRAQLAECDAATLSAWSFEERERLGSISIR